MGYADVCVCVKEHVGSNHLIVCMYVGSSCLSVKASMLTTRQPEREIINHVVSITTHLWEVVQLSGQHCPHVQPRLMKERERDSAGRTRKRAGTDGGGGGDIECRSEREQ